jgi:hypothetical protein
MPGESLALGLRYCLEFNKIYSKHIIIVEQSLYCICRPFKEPRIHNVGAQQYDYDMVI